MVLRTKSKFAVSLRYFTCSIAVAAAGTTLCAQEGPDTESDGPTILNRSPFIPPDWEPPQTNRSKSVPKKSSTGYEFRGVYQLGNEYRFLISTPRTHNGKWVALEAEYEDYEVRGYDPSSETLTLYYDSKEEELKLAKMDANPTPMAVSGQVRKATARAKDGPGPVRRTIRPTSRKASTSSSDSSAPPPPAWLKKLREEAAERRSQAGRSGGSGGPGGAPPAGIGPSGNPGSANPPPNYTPPSPPQELLDLDIPPPPTGLPPSPPPDVLQKIQDSLYNRNPGS